MTRADRWIVQVDDQGHLTLPAELRERFGISAGDQLLIRGNQDLLTFHRPVNSLARVNLEVTNQCNLNCRTCMRNVWDEPGGTMSGRVFDRFLKDLEKLSPKPTIFFGGFGEPLFHADIIEMVSSVKKLGTKVELITNGTLLDEKMALSLIEAGLDRLWVSLDGVKPECYADVRLGSALPQILQNMKNLYALRNKNQTICPHIGVAFVAMQRNISELPELIRTAAQFGAEEFSVSNVLAHTPELRKEILYSQCMYDVAYLESSAIPHVQTPRMDITADTFAIIGSLLQSGYWTNIAGAQWVQPLDLCPFFMKGSTSIRWDGQVSPCLPLLHTHEAYLDDRLRESKACSFGSILEEDLMTIWQDKSYVNFRQRLQSFDFSPCVICNSCEMANNNEEDCYGNEFPTCGGCLWAQGLIHCP